MAHHGFNSSVGTFGPTVTLLLSPISSPPFFSGGAVSDAVALLLSPTSPPAFISGAAVPDAAFASSTSSRGKAMDDALSVAAPPGVQAGAVADMLCCSPWTAGSALASASFFAAPLPLLAFVSFESCASLALAALLSFCAPGHIGRSQRGHGYEAARECH